MLERIDREQESVDLQFIPVLVFVLQEINERNIDMPCNQHVINQGDNQSSP
jgi:hypothetical protein